MRADANQIAFDVVGAVLDAAHPLALEVAGTRVTVAVKREPAPPWPQAGFDGVTPRGSLHAPVRADCSWQGGGVTLTIDCFPHRRRAEETVCIRVSRGRRLILMSNVKACLEDVLDGQAGYLTAFGSTAKRGPEGLNQSEVNRVIHDLVLAAGFQTRGRRTVLAQIRCPAGAIEDGPAEVFRRVILLALIKLDFIDRRRAANRGARLIDLDELGLSPGAIAALTTTDDNDESAADVEDTQDDDDNPFDRIKRRMARAIPDEDERASAMKLLAYAVENAHDEKPDGWSMHDRGAEVTLFTGRLAACRLSRGSIALSVMGPINAETQAALGANVEDNDAWKAIPGGLFLEFPAVKAAVALELLKDPFERFVDEAMARMRRRIDPDDHAPAIVAYLSDAVGRPLPQPNLSVAGPGDEEDDDVRVEDLTASREPKARGRAPIFEHSQRAIVSLISDVELGVIALPDLQRPFVWPDSKVRDLLDSLFVGFPVGTVVLWHTSEPSDARTIGRGADAQRAGALVIDGQQRLTSLFAVIKGAQVTDKDGNRRQIKIAFRPRDGRFSVPDAAIRLDPEYLEDVSELWGGKRTKGQIRKELLAGLKAKGRVLDASYEDAVEHNLDRAQSIVDFRFPVIDIRKTAQNEEATEEDVAEIFVRINNQGSRLGQADFVLTLLSVFHGKLRDKIEQRADAISAESVVAIDTQQLLRATCAVGFGRARMSAIYRFLRGVDPVSGDTNVDERRQRLEALDQAAEACIQPTTWRDYLLRVSHAGLVNQGLVASSNAVVNAFAFYVRGGQVGLEKHRLDQLISRWLFGTLLTARYSGSSETIFEQDLAPIRRLGTNDGEAFARVLDDMLSESITGDYWSRTLVADLKTQRARAPAALGFRAAQVVLGSKALFSDQSLQTFLTPGPSAMRAASEQHHLFPRAWLSRQGITERGDVNQVANLADVGWADNSDIGGASGPASYVPRMRDRLKLDDDRWGRMCAEHALPPGWEKLPYDMFLQQRRERMADIIRAAYRKLGGEENEVPIAPPWFMPGAELVWSRIVETERALRALVRDVYTKRFGEHGAAKIEAAIPERERESLSRALRSRPAGSDPMSVVDYLYVAQLPPLLFSNDVWQDAKQRLGNGHDSKQAVSTAITHITPVRNEIAHVREVSQDRLQKANVACAELLALLRGS